MADNKLSGLLTVKQIILDLLYKMKLSKSEYHYMFNMFLDAHKELQMYHVSTFEEQFIDINENHYVVLPADYLGFVSVGIMMYGRLYTFSYDNELKKLVTEQDGEIIVDTDAGDNVVKNTLYLQNYASPGLNDYKFILDEPNNRIILNGYVGTQVILRYKSTGINISGETYIRKKYKDVLQACMRHLYSVNNNEKDNIIGRNYELYMTEIYKIGMFESSSVDELYDAYYESSSQVLKG